MVVQGGHVNRGADVEMGVSPNDVKFRMDNNRPCSESEKSSKIATCHIIILLLLILTVIILVIGLLSRGFGTWEEGEDVCNTISCARASARIAYSMDETANPCQDFYQYVCGGYEKKKVIPPSATEISSWGSLTNEITVKIKSLLETKSSLDDLNAVKQMKVFYQSCMNEGAIEKVGTQPLKDLIMKFGGWGALGPNWNEANFNVEDYIIQMDNMEQSLVSWGMSINPYDSFERVATIQPAKLTLPSTALYTLQQVVTLLSQVIMKVMSQALSGDAAVLQTEIPKMVAFEVELATLMSAKKVLPKPEQIMTLEKVSLIAPNIDVQKILNGALTPVVFNKTSRVYISDPDNLKKLSELIGRTPKRTIAAYILYSAMRPYVTTLTKETRKIMEDIQRVLTGASGEPARYETCTALVNQQFSLVLARLFITDYYKGGTVEIERMTEHLENIFKKRLDGVDWLDQTSRQKALSKVMAMILKLGYPKEILENAKLEEQVSVNDLKPDDLFGNVLKIKAAVRKMIPEQLHKQHDRHEWLFPPPLTVNAFYSPQENGMTFPLGILQPPFFDPTGPRSLNYGAMGKVIGHEITHGFDSTGRSFDQIGNINEWMTKTSIDNFNKRAKCFEDQFSGIPIDQLGTKVNGLLTLGENIADAGAIKQSFQAYQDWVRTNGPEKPLPGLSLPHDKLFFVGFGQLYCRLITDQSLSMLSQGDNHTPHKQRVYGVLMNSDDFSRVFNCPMGSKYNPQKKCTVW